MFTSHAPITKSTNVGTNVGTLPLNRARRYKTNLQNRLAVSAYIIVFLSLFAGFTNKVDRSNFEGATGEALGTLLVVVTSTIIIFGIFVVFIELLQVTLHFGRSARLTF